MVFEMKLGYARVSTSDQKAAMQKEALRNAGADKVFVEKASGGRWDRPELHRLLDQLRKGDTLVVWKLDRLSRSLRDLLTILERLDQEGIMFQSLTEAIDTSTASGRAMMKMVGVFAEFERELIRERTKAGLDQARREGRVGGRPRRLTAKQQEEAVEMIKSGRKSQAEVARIFGVDPATVSRMMARAGAESLKS